MKTKPLPTALSGPRKLRLFAEDDEALIKLCDDVFPSTGLEIVELIRRAVHAGLPTIVKELRHGR